jgi:hypothetical protein
MAIDGSTIPNLVNERLGGSFAAANHALMYGNSYQIPESKLISALELVRKVVGIADSDPQLITKATVADSCVRMILHLTQTRAGHQPDRATGEDLLMSEAVGYVLSGINGALAGHTPKPFGIKVLLQFLNEIGASLMTMQSMLQVSLPDRTAERMTNLWNQYASKLAQIPAAFRRFPLCRTLNVFMPSEEQRTLIQDTIKRGDVHEEVLRLMADEAAVFNDSNELTGTQLQQLIDRAEFLRQVATQTARMQGLQDTGGSLERALKEMLGEALLVEIAEPSCAKPCWETNWAHILRGVRMAALNANQCGFLVQGIGIGCQLSAGAVMVSIIAGHKPRHAEVTKTLLRQSLEGAEPSGPVGATLSSSLAPTQPPTLAVGGDLTKLLMNLADGQKWRC